MPIEHPHGCSVILPTTEKGKKLIDGIVEEFHLFERSVDEAVEGNDQLRHPKTDFRIKIFKKIVNVIGVENAYKLCIMDKIVYNTKVKPIIKRK